MRQRNEREVDIFFGEGVAVELSTERGTDQVGLRAYRTLGETSGARSEADEALGLGFGHRSRELAQGSLTIFKELGPQDEARIGIISAALLQVWVDIGVEADHGLQVLQEASLQHL